MRPKSPFLQNLRKKTPAPQMRKKEQSTQPRTGRGNGGPASVAPGFTPFAIDGEAPARTPGFSTFHVQPDPQPDVEEPSEPEIDIEAERKQAFEAGYAKAKGEFIRYKKEAERLEQSFQELLNTIQESRRLWVQEVKEGVAESMQEALHHIARHEHLQSAILTQKLSEALEQLADEKNLSVFVAPKDVALAEQFLTDKDGWTVLPSEEVDGGAILESENGVWDARMQVTLDEIDDLLATWMVDSETNI